MEFTVMEDLWFGDLEDPAQQLAANSFVAQLAEMHGLRPFPLAAQKLLTTIQDPDYKTSTLEQIIESDPALAVRGMRVVNSAAYALAKKCAAVAAPSRRCDGELRRAE